MSTRRRKIESSGARRRPLPVALVVALAALSLPAGARAEDVTPQVLPDRIEDVPSTKPDPFPAFDNFAWRAFIALNWPSLPDLAHRGEPDRTKTIGDAGPRVWETFKSRYELFQLGADGKPLPPSSWIERRRPKPMRPGCRQSRQDAREFRSLRRFQSGELQPRRVSEPARRAEPDLYPLRNPDQPGRIRRHRLERMEPRAATCRTRLIPPICRSDRLR